MTWTPKNNAIDILKWWNNFLYNEKNSNKFFNFVAITIFTVIIHSHTIWTKLKNYWVFTNHALHNQKND